MLRSFLSVGQGAFYCEHFEKEGSCNDINIVYDCGTMTDVRIVEQEIQNNFQAGEIIEALFISHLHEDHINGIPFLLKYCNVKRIYFPHIISRNRKFMEIYYRVNNITGFTFDFFMDPYDAVRNLSLNDPPELIAIDESGEGSERNEGINIRQETVKYQSSGSNVFESIKGDNEIDDIAYDRWLYIPFNFRQDARVRILLSNLNNQFGRDITEEDLMQLWENNDPSDCERIKQAYRDVQGDFNTNSMVLFSGEINDNMRQYGYGNYSKCCFSGHIIKKSGCLYTGDYDAAGKMKWKELTDAYQTYWKHIGCVQIPHHGSYHNFNPDFLKMDAFFVISAGYANRYHHPHASVVKAFLFKGIMPYIVTEQVGSTAFFVI